MNAQKSGLMPVLGDAVRIKTELRTFGTLVFLTAFALLPAPRGLAQNAAQRAALAKLAKAHAAGHPNSLTPNTTEATSLGLSKPGGLAFDAPGDLYIADTGQPAERPPEQ